MKRLSGIAFLAMLLLASASFKGYASDDAGEEVKLYMGEMKYVLASNPSRVAIGNPAIADIASVSKTEVAITPKSVGNTTLVIWDNFGEQSYTIRVFAEDTSETKRRVDALIERLNLPEVYTKANDDEAKVIILGKVNNKEDQERIATILGKLKDKTVDLTSLKEEKTVIEIDSQILEIQKGAEQNLGFQWPTSFTLSDPTSSAGGVAPIQVTGTNWGSVFRMSQVARSSFTLTLNTLEQEEKVHVLSRPRISCLSGKEAKLLVGGSVPIISGTLTPGAGSSGGLASTGGSVEYKDYGITLNIKPRVDEFGRIRLNLDLEVTDVGNEVTTSFALAYTFTKRTATTEVYLDDGETFAIGGLIQHKTEKDLNKFPWLSEIPILGAFFRNTTTTQGQEGLLTKNDTDLFITLTPHIVKQEMKPEDKEQPTRNITPTVSVEDTMDPAIKYYRIIQQRILDNLTYPQNARQAGFQGTTRLRLKLSYQGELLDAEVKSSSGYKVLDDNAVNTAKMSTSYPPFPPAITDKEIWVEIPVIYQLE